MKKFLIKNRNKHIYGVSLIEILVAMSILTVGLFMIYNIFPLGFAAAYRSKNRTIATQLAQQRLEEILTNSRPVACQQQSSRPCVMRPLETDPANPIDYTATFDCRYYYGGAFVNNRVQDATYCGIHSGPIDSAASWSRFPSTAGDESFWYHIEVMPVTDPAQKFRSLANMSRITVTIRGPIADMNTWEELAQTTSTGGLARKRNMMPTEVFISTLVTNKSLPFTEIDNSYNTGNYRYGVFDNRSGYIDSYTPGNANNPNGRRIRVNNIRNFSMFHHVGLSQAERDDTSLVRYYRSAPNGSGNFVTTIKPGNFYGLDNVLIVRRLIMLRNGTPFREHVATQTARVMAVFPAGNPNPETTREIPGDLLLFNPLHVDRHVGMYYDNNWLAVAHTDASIVDKERFYGFSANDFDSTYGYTNVASRATGYALHKPVYNANWVGRHSSFTAETPANSTPTGYDIPYHGSSLAGTFSIQVGGAEGPGGTILSDDQGYGFKHPANPATDIRDVDFAVRRRPGQDGFTDWVIGAPANCQPGWTGYSGFYADNINTILNHRFPADGMPMYERVHSTPIGTPPNLDPNILGGIRITSPEIIPDYSTDGFEYRYEYRVIHLTNVKTQQ